MLEELTPAQFDEWFAFYTLEPWGQDWHRSGTVAAAVDGGFRAIIAGLAGEELTELPKARDYVPRLTTKGKPQRVRIDTTSIERFARQMEQQARALERYT